MKNLADLDNYGHNLTRFREVAVRVLHFDRTSCPEFPRTLDRGRITVEKTLERTK